jgi:7,8-dihydropterin-6-yl-methyl-4-(beta-D-ribofuranosyl)aminobenzene 5'-phosphate synthase
MDRGDGAARLKPNVFGETGISGRSFSPPTASDEPHPSGSRGAFGKSISTCPASPPLAASASGRSPPAALASARARTLVDDRFFLSGEIPRVTPYEKGLPPQVKRGRGGEWEPDPLVMDERFLAVHVRDRGIVVFSSCSHAGIVNAVTHAAELFDPIPIHGIFGGLHLSGAANEQWIDATVDDLARFRLGRIVPAHCTGYRAVHRLIERQRDVVIPSAVGHVHRI